MKNLVSFCVAVAVAAYAVPAMAQCTSCGGGAPVFSQPVMMNSYAPQATYSAPVMSQQVYSAPMSQPVYSAPMSQPVYSSPVVSAPMSQPVYNAPMSQPVYSSAPMMSSGCGGCCGGCGGGMVMGSPVMGGTVMGGEVISGSTVGNGQIISGGIVGGGQIISWEGGTEIQGTIVSDVVVEGGEAAAPMTEGGNAVDVVEPPAAEGAKDAPGPDTDGESMEGET